MRDRLKGKHAIFATAISDDFLRWIEFTRRVFKARVFVHSWPGPFDIEMDCVGGVTNNLNKGRPMVGGPLQIGATLCRRLARFRHAVDCGDGAVGLRQSTRARPLTHPPRGASLRGDAAA